MFPIARFVPVAVPDLHINWPVLLTMVPISCLFAASLGLMFGTIFQPRTVPILFGVIVVPMTFLGCVYYPWKTLEAIPWLQFAVLVNPLVYMCEGFRAALTTSEHMSLWAVYTVLIAATAACGSIAIHFFKRRVIV